MITLLRKLFYENWQRKCISLILAVIIWFTVNQSLITSRTLTNIPVRVINIPAGKTIAELQSSGTLAKRLTLTLIGNKTLLEELTSNDIEVVVDAHNKEGEWIEFITLRNLTSLNPEINLSKGISRVSPQNIHIRLTKLVTEKIPVYITQPIGQAPKDYQFLDIWPYQLSLSVSGSEEMVKRLKAKGIRLTFDLSNISKAELDLLRTRPDSNRDEVSFFVPEQWTRVSIPQLSETPIEIDDPRAKDLRIDFIRISAIPINAKIPLSLYFPLEDLAEYNPQTYSFGVSPLVEKQKGIYLFTPNLFAKGVSPLFVQVVEQMIQMSITVEPPHKNPYLNWSIEFINPRLLEDRFVSLMMSDVIDEDLSELQPLVREEYLRDRFRRYMNRFQLFQSDESRLELNIFLQNGKVMIEEGSKPFSNSTLLKKE